MESPDGFFSAPEAAALLHLHVSGEAASANPEKILLSALVSGALVAQGIILNALRSSPSPASKMRLAEIPRQAWHKMKWDDAAGDFAPKSITLQNRQILKPVFRQISYVRWLLGGEQKLQRAISSAPHWHHDSSPPVHPAGYVAFAEIPREMRAWASAGKLDPDYLALLDPVNTNALGSVLASGALPAFGVNKRTGHIVRLTRELWRMEFSNASQLVHALEGNDVLNGHNGAACLPMLMLSDLARLLDMKDVPPLPADLPKDWLSDVPRQASNDNGTGVHWYVRGYAEGLQARGGRAKREDTIAAARKSLGCTVEQAEAAFEALPYPDLRNRPRGSTA